MRTAMLYPRSTLIHSETDIGAKKEFEISLDYHKKASWARTLLISYNYLKCKFLKQDLS